MNYKTTADISVSPKLVGQVVGQEKGVEIISKAADQKRNVLLIGSPGTGKSMLAQAMAELLPVEKLEDVLVFPNPADANNPKIGVMPAGEGRKVLENERKRAFQKTITEFKPGLGPFFFIMLLFTVSIGAAAYLKLFSDVILAALIITGGLFLMVLLFASSFAAGMKQMRFGSGEEQNIPKLLINNSDKKTAPFVEATGAHAGALLGDCRHDPYQCIPAGETICLENGKLVEIDELVDPYFEQKSGHEIEIPSFKICGGFDSDFDFGRADAFRAYRRWYAGDLIEIKTRLGNKIRVTPEHPLAFLSPNTAIDYVHANKLQARNFVIVPKNLPSQQNSANVPFKLYADIIADAYVSDRNVQFKFARKFKIETVKKDALAVGFEPKIIEKKYTRIGIYCSELARELKKIGLVDRKQKRIPKLVFDARMEDIMTFISRLLSLDGHVGKNGQFELLSSSEGLIKDLQILLLKFGVKATYKTRLDTGYKKGNIQHRLQWADYEWAKLYQKLTVNPIHKTNLKTYFKNASSEHVAFHDVIPIDFNQLENIRNQLGLSKTKVHREYYALNQDISSSKMPTRQMLLNVLSSFKAHGSNGHASGLEKLVNGNYAFDEIISVKKVPYEGYVYNLTTDTGNYLVGGILTHNSGGLGTPPHLRIEAGMIHKANKGVLYIDEVAGLSPKSQQELLTAMQEKKYSITGQSEMSSGAMVRSEPVPCDFLLVASGNVFDLDKMHPALRSRIRGYGYEVYLNEDMDDTPANREKLAVFVAQEVTKDGKIPHFEKTAAEEIILEAKRRAGRKKKLTLKLRDLGGLVRAAGDIARIKHKKFVTREDVLEAKKVARTMEQQIADKQIMIKKDYEIFKTTGFAVGRVNGLAVMGDGGIILPIEAEVVPAQSANAGKTIATGKLGVIAKEAVQNVSAVIKKYKGTPISSYDIHIQFLQTYEGVEGDSASVSVATAVVSALEQTPIDQSVAMTGSLSVKGEVLPVGGITPKVEAAIEAGAKTVIVPDSNKEDLFLTKEKLGKIRVVPAKDIADVLRAALKPGPQKNKLLAELRKTK